MDHHGNGELQSEQAGRVVDEAFSLKEIDNALRNTETLGSRGGGNRIRSGDHCTGNATDAPVEPGKDPVRGFGDSQNREADESKGEEENANDVVGEIAPGGEPGCGVDQGRQDRGRSNQDLG
jgi:hypothetical protein